MSKYKYIYGPVLSFRLGRSLGIDLLSQEEKICSFNCIYCQLGKTLTLTNERGLFIHTPKIIEELKAFPKIPVDYITFSGRGEPTLSRNLGEAIKAVKGLRREPVAVLTNSSLINRREVREELALADFVMVKLDADSQGSLELINRPVSGTEFGEIYNGIKRFRREYSGKLAIQIMFMAQNIENASSLAKLSKEIQPDEVQICTPLRPCGIRPLEQEEIYRIKEYFKGMRVVSVYDRQVEGIKPLNQEATSKRRGEFI